MTDFKVLHNDCVEAMRSMPDARRSIQGPPLTETRRCNR